MRFGLLLSIFASLFSWRLQALEIEGILSPSQTLDGFRISSGPPPLTLGSSIRWIQNYSFAQFQPNHDNQSKARDLSSWHLLSFKASHGGHWSFGVPIHVASVEGVSLWNLEALNFAPFIGYSQEFETRSGWIWTIGAFFPDRQDPLFILPVLGLNFENPASPHWARLGFPVFVYRYQASQDLGLGASIRWRSARFLRDPDSSVRYLQYRHWALAGHAQYSWFSKLFCTLSVGYGIEGNVSLLDTSLKEVSRLRSYAGWAASLALSYQFSGRPPRF